MATKTTTDDIDLDSLNPDEDDLVDLDDWGPESAEDDDIEDEDDEFIREMLGDFRVEDDYDFDSDGSWND